MRCVTKHLAILFLLLTVVRTASSQSNSFNLNIDNGLSSNHTYSTLVDHLGYLWITTDNGVIKYNGYDFKIFSVEYGLPTNDVWQLIEDNNGRIWLGCIADRMGYIKNDVYHDAVFATSTPRVIYPSNLKIINGHIAFFNRSNKVTVQSSFFYEKNDTIVQVDIADAIKNFYPTFSKVANGTRLEILTGMINEQGTTIMTYGDTIYHYIVRNRQAIITKKIYSKGINDLFTHHNTVYIRNNIILSQNMLHKGMFSLNVNTGTCTEVPIKDNAFIGPFYDNSTRDKGDEITILSKGSELVYKARKNIELTHKTNINGLFKCNINDITTIIGDCVWGKRISSTSAGVFINFPQQIYFRKIPEIMRSQYRYIGSCNAGIAWIDKNNDLCFYKNGKFSLYNNIINTRQHFNGISQINKEQFYLFGSINYVSDRNLMHFTQMPIEGLGVSLRGLVMKNDSVAYAINPDGFYSVNLNHGEKQKIFFDYDRYSSLFYDKTQQTYWAYNTGKIAQLTPSGLKLFSGKYLSKFGVNRIDKIATDTTNGNIFLLGDNKISLFNTQTQKYRYILPNINHAECTIEVNNNILIEYGRFGILFCKIYGRDSLSTPFIYPNVKNTVFKKILDIGCTSDSVFLNTNNGLYICPIPSEFVGNIMVDNFKFVYCATELHRQIYSGDTIKINKKNYTLHFDVINPIGNGKVKLLVTVNGKTTELNGLDYALPDNLQQPDNYLKISILAYDKSFRSEPVNLTIYIIPQWYQTKTMVKVIWGISILAFVLIIVISILITRRLVLNANKKRNLRMELELKSIYAQINPHFIFNSLNSALLLVSKNKTEEAYTHISKFSKLLRSYIKSSRNKLILLSDEIKNLTNYIDLQQVRFKDKFGYSIDVAPDVAANDIYIPSLLLQPFVENAIEHGLLSKEIAGHLSVNFLKKGNKLLCVIEDNGVGRKESKLNKIPNPVKDESYGELLIKDLVNIFNKYEHMNIHIEYEDKVAPLTGTVVTIYINLES